MKLMVLILGTIFLAVTVDYQAASRQQERYQALALKDALTVDAYFAEDNAVQDSETFAVYQE